MGLSPADLHALAVSAEHHVLRTGAASRGPRVRWREHHGPLRGRGAGLAGRRMSGDAALRQEDLHASVSAPVLETMNFLNEITSRYPKAISFAPGRPYEGFFETKQVFRYIRTYLDYLAENSPGEVRRAIFQYGPTAGRPEVRELIARSLRDDENIDVPADSIVVTVGCQEAMLLVLRALIA